MLNGGNRAILKAISAMQTVFLMYNARGALFNSPLRADTDTFSTTNTGIGNHISFRCNFPVPDCVAFPENRIYAEIEILDRHILYTEDNADIAGVSGVYIGEIRLFFKYQIPPLILFLRRSWFYCPSHADHLFIHRITENLNLWR